jgi:hypothetical protein
MSLLGQFYKPRASMPRAKRLLFGILADVTDRRGWRQEWDQMDDDIREEILETWLKLIEQHNEEKP